MPAAEQLRVKVVILSVLVRGIREQQLKYVWGIANNAKH
jgi:hypothetical protein